MRPNWTLEDLRLRERALRSSAERRRRELERRERGDGPTLWPRRPDPR